MSSLSAARLAPRRLSLPWSLKATPLRVALVVTGAWRLVIGGWGLVAHGIVPPGPYASQNLLHPGWPSNPLSMLLDAGVRMDAFWYAGIAQHGYSYSSGGLKSIAYFPLYPLLVKVASFGTGNVYVAGMLISTLSLFLAVWALSSWLELKGHASSSPLAVALMLCFPVGFFWVAMYTESLFLALAVACLVLYERQRWELSAACAFLAVLTRPTGLILAPCLLLLALPYTPKLMSNPRLPGWFSKLSKPRSEAPSQPHSFMRPWIPALAVPTAYALFAAYQWVTFGNPLATVQADQAAPFSRNLSEGLKDLTLNRPGFPSWYLGALLVLGMLFLAAVPLVYRRFGAPYALFAALTVLFPMSTGLVSLERYVMIDFPVFAALATSRRRLLPVSLAVIGFYLSLGLCALFVNGYTII